jgi:hypothetical protein
MRRAKFVFDIRVAGAAVERRVGCGNGSGPTAGGFSFT